MPFLRGSRELGAQKMLRDGHGICFSLCAQGDELEKEPLKPERRGSQARNQGALPFFFF